MLTAAPDAGDIATTARRCLNLSYEGEYTGMLPARLLSGGAYNGQAMVLPAASD